jgi:DNA polymerase-3 subunit delta
MFYVFHGDDTHAQHETLNSLLSRFGDREMLDLNTTRFEGRISFIDLEQACHAMPFLASVRLVIGEGVLSANSDKEFTDRLKEMLPGLPETTRLVFMEPKQLSSRHAIVKLAESAENGYVKAFTRPEGRQLEQWIRKRVGEKDGRISPQASQLLAATIGNEMAILDNEIEKLVLYTAGDEIQSRHVQRLSPQVAEANIFDLVDAIGNRNGKKAALLLQQKLAEGADPFYLFAMLVRQFRLLIQVKELADAGQRPPAIAKAIKQHPYVVGKMYQQARGFSLAQLERIYHHLLEMDVAVKTGENDMVTGLNLLIAGLTLS